MGHKVVLEFDDFSPKNTNFGLLEEIHSHFPKFKVTLFTVPWEIRFGGDSPITDPRFEPFCNALRKSADWIEIALHGLTHKPEEFLDLTHEEARKRVLVGEKMLINRHIPYAKIFKAPYWQLSDRAKVGIEELGFKVCEDHYYNWNLKDEFPITDEMWVIGHGHIQMTTGNGLEEVLPRILKLPTDTDFHFLSEYLEAEVVDEASQDKGDPIDRVKVELDGVFL